MQLGSQESSFCAVYDAEIDTCIRFASRAHNKENALFSISLSEEKPRRRRIASIVFGKSLYHSFWISRQKWSVEDALSKDSMHRVSSLTFR